MKRLCAILLLLALLFSCSVAGATDSTQGAASGGTLALDASGDAVLQLQTRLTELGFFTDKTDGFFGVNTQAAVLAFQTFLTEAGYDVPADGTADAATRHLLNDAAVSEQRLTLKQGDKNPLVRKLQQRLNELGYLFGSVDGVFGGKTVSALETFQRMLVDSGAEGATVSGVLDSATRGYLDSDLSGFKMVTPVFFDEDDPLSLEDRYLYAQACLLMDADTGEVLYAKNENDRMYPASTTKIMTLLLALDHEKLKKVVTVPKSAAQVPGDSSLVPVHPGEQMPFQDLLYGLVLRSGNDAANAIATLTAGSTDKFVKQMNKKAAALGLRDTHYMNPHGYHDDAHYTTAADMATLARYALKNKQFRAIVSSKSYTMSATAQRKALTLTNQYELLHKGSQYYYPDAFGIKTGYTSAAGYCYVGAAARDGKTLIAVVLHCGAAQPDKWVDVKRLFNYGFETIRRG